MRSVVPWLIAALSLTRTLGANPIPIPTPQAAPGPPPVASSKAIELQQLQVAPGLRLAEWAAEPQFENPVAFSLVGLPAREPNRPPELVAFVAEDPPDDLTVPDNTQGALGLLDDLSLRTVEDREAFLSQRSAINAPLRNRDPRQIRQLADTDGDGRADEVEVFAGDFTSLTGDTSVGVLAHGAEVWFVGSPDLWRLGIPSLTNVATARARAHASTRSRLTTGLGVHLGAAGRDRYGLVFGPDGRLYLGFDDRGVRIVTRERTEISLPDTGGVLRCEPDGGNLEEFCRGLRNPGELAFDDLGNLFAIDNAPAGTNESRVLHLIEGADYGWRSSYQHMKGFGPWIWEGLWAGGLDGILPPAGQIGQGSAGLTWYPGTGFGDRFRNRFLHANPGRGIGCFGLTRRGASFAVTDPQTVLGNCQPTDVDFGPDGALFVLDRGGHRDLPGHGRIYRLTSMEPDSPDTEPHAAETFRLLADPLALAATPERELLTRLSHPDRRVRLDAQFELARRGPDSFRGLRTVAFGSEATLPRLHALWAVGQIARRYDIGQSGGDFSDELASMLRLLDDADEAVAATAARVLTDAQLVHADLPVAALTTEASPRLRFEAAMALGTLMNQDHRASATLAQKSTRWLDEHLPHIGRLATRYVDQSVAFHPGWDTLRDLVRTNTQRDPFLDYAAARHFQRLERQEAGWGSYRGLSGSLRARMTDTNPAVRHVALLALRRLTNAAAADLLGDPDPRVAWEAARAIHDVPIAEALPRLAGLIENPSGATNEPAWIRIPDQPLATYLAAHRSLAQTQGQAQPASPTNTATMRDQFLRRVLNAQFRLGQPEHAARLARFAATADSSHPASARAEALFLLGSWEVTEAKPGAVPVRILPDPRDGKLPAIHPENWPGWFDRVVGLWRPLTPRSGDAARDTLRPLLERLLDDPELDVAQATLDAAIRLNLTEANALLARPERARLRNRPTPTP